jgi:signal transduction histidine kinase
VLRGYRGILTGVPVPRARPANTDEPPKVTVVERRILIYRAVARTPCWPQGAVVGGPRDAGLQWHRAMLTALAEGAGALLVVEEVVSGAAMQPLKRFVEAQPGWSDLPVLVLTKRGADSLEAQRAVEHLGNVTLLERPVRTIALISAARSALRARERQYQVRLADQRKDEFLATLAHELRNPLAPIRTSMAILRTLQPFGPGEKLRGRGGPPGRSPHAAGRRPARRGPHHHRQGGAELHAHHAASVLTHALEIAASAMEEQAPPARVREPDATSRWTPTTRAWCRAWPTCW